jgi:hypothetical protein
VAGPWRHQRAGRVALFRAEQPFARRQERSAANRIVAPRLFAYAVFGDAWNGGATDTPEQARAWVRWAAKTGYDGVKFFNDKPRAVTAAAIDEARKLKLGTVAHLGQSGVAEVNARIAGELGLGTVTHFYGHFESLLKDGRLPNYPASYNMTDEQDRFAEIANFTGQIVEPGGPEWRAYLAAHLERGTIFDPTFNIYSASRDLMRARNADWHDRYTLPSLYDFYRPSRVNHGSYWYDWTTAKEVAWRRFYVPYMRLMNDYKNMGGRVTAGSDPGYIYQTWGFAYVQELEMLQEAGFSPLEVIQAATTNGAHAIYDPKGIEPPMGWCERACSRSGDHARKPAAQFQDAVRHRLRTIGRQRTVERVGGIRYVLKDGVVYNPRALLGRRRRDGGGAEADQGRRCAALSVGTAEGRRSRYPAAHAACHVEPVSGVQQPPGRCCRDLQAPAARPPWRLPSRQRGKPGPLAAPAGR